MKKEWINPELKMSGVENTRTKDKETCPYDNKQCGKGYRGYYCHKFKVQCPLGQDPGGEGGANEELDS